MTAKSTEYVLSNGHKFKVHVAEGDIGEEIPKGPPLEPGFNRVCNYYNANVTRGVMGVWVDVEVFKR